MTTTHAHPGQVPATKPPAAPTAGHPSGRSPAAAARYAVLSIAVFDVGGPYLAYSQLTGHGFRPATALVLSGILPAAGVILGVIRKHRVDVIGVLVLAGILVGTVLGLLTGSARAVLLEGSVPTLLTGVAFLGSLLTRRPLMFRLSAEFAGGEDSPRGREMAAKWAEPAFRHAITLITAVWGAGYLAEAAARVIIVANTSTSTALLASKVLPWVVTGLLFAWTFGYRQWRLARLARRGGQAA
jgi:hypothetical protein